ncbi:MAG TPA: MFS transporter [Polyangia bacterium]|nr:MFS transporter [Polyangia bacterium]
MKSESEPRGDDPLSRRRRPTGNFADGLRSMRGLPRVVWVLGVASLLNDVSSEAIFPLLPGFLTSLGAPMGFIGLIEGSADALSSILKVVAGRLSDKGPRRLFVAGGYTIPALARAAIAAATAPVHVLAARLLDRTGKGIRSGPRDAMIADSVRPTQRGRAFGLNRSMDHFGAAVGPLLASLLLYVGLGTRTVFLVAAAIGMMAPLMLFFRLREQPRDAVDLSGPIGMPEAGALRRGYSSYLVACVLFALGNSSDAFLLIRAHEVGWANTQLPLLWAFHHLVKSMAALPGGTLSDRHSRGTVVSFGWAAYALTYVGFGFARERWQILGLFLVYALYHGLAEGAERAIVADLSDRGARGRAYGLYHGLIGAAALPAGIGTGLIWDRWGPAWALSANAAFAAGAAVFLFMMTFAGPLRRAPASAR